MRIAIVGTGSIGQRHAATLLRLGYRDLIAVSEHSRRATFTVDDVDIPVVHHYADVLDGTVDLVVICNPTSMHRAHLAAAIEAGVDAFVEKPVHTSAVGLAELETEADRRGVILGVGHQFRFNESLIRVRDAVKSGRLGRVLAVEAHLGEHIDDYHPGEDYRRGYAARRDLGGGVLLTQIHQIDYLDWIFGPFEVAFAAGGRLSDLEIDVEDSVSYLLRAHDGVAVYGHLDYLQRPKRVTLGVTGTAGRMDWDYFADSVAFTPAQPDAETELTTGRFDRDAMFTELFRDFLESVHHRRPPRSTLGDGLRALRIVDAITRSMRDACAVPISQ